MNKYTKLIALICAFGACAFPLSACHGASPPTSSSLSSSGTENLSQEDSFSSSFENENSSSSANSASSSSSNSNSSNSSSSSAAVTPITEKAQYIRCTGDNVNVRAGAGMEFTVLGQAEKNTVYAVIGKSGDWYKTFYRGKVAYLYASYASVFTLEKSKNEQTEKVLTEGYKLIGVPYVYGAVRLHDGKGKLLKGFSAQAFDCSSLVQYVFYKGANEILQVTTRTQVKQGKYVAPSDLRRGDCIYFTNAERQHKTGVERIGHVAIYLGNNYILHTASDYARIEKISQTRWNYYVEARRFL